MPWTRYLSVRRAEGETFLLRRRRVPVIDQSYGDPRLARIRAAAGEGAGAWPAVRAELAAAEDGEDLAFLVEGAAAVAGTERWIGAVVAAAGPGDPLPLLVSGARHIGWAWHPRDWSDAPQGSQEPDPPARARLETAEEQLREAAGREPGSAAPHYFLQVSGRGLRIGPPAAERRFEATRGRAPGHAPAHRQHLQQLSAESGGSHERMHAFARASILAAPEGSRLGELVALAHLEEWRALGADPDSAYLGRRQVVDELYEAAARSVLHPAFVRRRDWVLAFNAFAMAFSLAGEYHAARPLFRTLGKRATETPWRYLDERSPLVPFLAWRSRVNR